MRTNSYGLPIKNYANRPDVDPAIVHVVRDSLAQSTDYNAVIYPTGYIKAVASLDAARALAYAIYHKGKGKLPPNIAQLRRAHELQVRSTR